MIPRIPQRVRVLLLEVVTDDGYAGHDLPPQPGHRCRTEFRRCVAPSRAAVLRRHAPRAASICDLTLERISFQLASNLSTPSRSSVATTSSYEMPSVARSSITFWASAYEPRTASGLTSPWSANAWMVGSGMVFTTPGATNCSTYITSRYAGFFVDVDAHSGRCGCAPAAASVAQRSVENAFSYNSYAS